MSHFDRKLAGVFKSAAKPGATDDDLKNARKELADIQGRFLDANFQSSLERMFEALAPPPAQAKLGEADCLRWIEILNAKELPRTAEVVFTILIGNFKNAGLEIVLPAAPTAKCVDAWIKATGEAKKAVQEKILADPDAAYATAGCDWFLTKGEKKKALPLLRLLLAKRPRPNHLAGWETVASDAIAKDKKGVLLELALSLHPQNPGALATLASLAINDGHVCQAVMDQLPVLSAKKTGNGQCIEFIRTFLEQVINTHGDRRQCACAGIARVTAGILLAKDPAKSREMLHTLQKGIGRIKTTTLDDEMRAVTWIMEPMKAPEQESPTGTVHVTQAGARHLAIAFEKAARGFGANEILALTARNLGLTVLGQKGEQTSYNPILHADSKGGLIPGDQIEINEPGWMLKDEVVVRAKVGPRGNP